MEEDAVLDLAARDPRMPWRDDVDFVAARGHAFGNRLHEGADGIPGEPRIGRRHHHHDVTGHDRPRARSTSRHGMISDSINTFDESFDWPRRRSMKMIGTSPMRKPRRLAS